MKELKEPKISIIVPVYNVEKYVEKCLKSLANQTMQDFEIIIVNDGSKDNSEEIIKNFKENHPNLQIKYLKKENGGLASARNYGVKYATGKYISFIDSDDYVDSNLYKNLEKYMDEDIDLIKFKMQTVDETGKILEKLDGPVFEKRTGEDGFKRLFAKDNFIDPACIYLYRREFFIKNKFKYRLRYHEDFGLTSLIIVRANSFVSTNVFGYNYLQTEESLTRSRDANKDVARAKDMLKHYDNMLIQIDGYNIKKETKEMVKKYYTNSVILKVNTLIGEERKEYIKEIRNRKMYKNIKADNIKQFIKRNILKFDINLYLKLR